MSDQTELCVAKLCESLRLVYHFRRKIRVEYFFQWHQVWVSLPRVIDVNKVDNLQNYFWRLWNLLVNCQADNSSTKGENSTTVLPTSDWPKMFTLGAHHVIEHEVKVNLRALKSSVSVLCQCSWVKHQEKTLNSSGAHVPKEETITVQTEKYCMYMGWIG